MSRLWPVLLIMLCASFSSAAAHELTPDQLRRVRFDQQLGQTLPLDLHFHDDEGRAVALRDYFGERPVILSLNYFHCQHLCPIELDGVLQALNGVSFTLGQEFTLVSVGID